MDPQIFLLLLQDGLTTGAIYLLLALGLLLVFSVTRIIFIPQGDFIAYGALTFAFLLEGSVPGTLWLLDALAVVGTLWDIIRPGPVRRSLAGTLLRGIGPAVLLTALTLLLVRLHPWAPVMGVLAIAIVAALGPHIYRIAYAPVKRASVLTLLILSMAVHYVLIGFGLIFFGPEGYSTPAFTTASVTIGGVDLSGQSLCVFASAAVLVVLMRWLFGHTLSGKALRAAASNPLGARLMGIDEATTGKLSFLLTAALGAFAGLLVGPITPIAYDTGFEIGLKGFVAAIMGGLVSYPIAAIGALVVGVVESVSSFWYSAYQAIIVFTLIIPVLVFLSVRRRSVNDE